jgi:hypothetical protein
MFIKGLRILALILPRAFNASLVPGWISTLSPVNFLARRSIFSVPLIFPLRMPYLFILHEEAVNAHLAERTGQPRMRDYPRAGGASPLSGTYALFLRDQALRIGHVHPLDI